MNETKENVLGFENVDLSEIKLVDLATQKCEVFYPYVYDTNYETYIQR